MKLKHLFALLPLLFASCSTIDKKDCNTDMHELGLRQGRMGSPKKYTDEIRNVCRNRQPFVDLQQYELGFKKGWIEFCRPANALAMGKADDPYASFCPENRENLFREKYLIGKQIHELKDQEEELAEEIESLRTDHEKDDDSLAELKRLEKDLVDLRRNIQQLEIKGLRDTLTLINQL